MVAPVVVLDERLNAMDAANHRCYADHAVQRTVKLLENVPFARDTYRLRFACPEIAQRATPGQFLMVRLGSGDDPLLARPLALYDTAVDGSGQAEAIDLVYLVVGRMTRRLAAWRPGQTLEVWGPLGNGFSPQACDELIMVAGGIGQTPFLSLAHEHLQQRAYGQPVRQVPRVGRVVLCYGVRTAAYLAGVEDFRQAGVEVRISTDDGTAGQAGLVTNLLAQLLQERPSVSRRIVCCGPEPMMAAVADLSRRHSIPAQVSLETPMACGIGICFSCVAPILEANGQSDYRRTCVEGPVFDAACIDWSRGDEPIPKRGQAPRNRR